MAESAPGPDWERRIDALLTELILDEKVDMLAGATWMDTPGNARLGIPPIRMADGPLGLRTWHFPYAVREPGASVPEPAPVRATAFPAGVALGASWNPELVRAVGAAMAREAKAHGRDMLLAPTVNIHRVPQGGRNFESYSEDPHLATRLAVAAVTGIQSEGVIACVKHFAVNNQEQNRYNVSAEVDERTLHELYLPAFRACVEEAGAWSVMASYNRVNGVWAAENAYLLDEVLKQRWGFRGFVVSDRVSTHTAVESANAGLDLEMPSGATRREFLARREPSRMLDSAGAQADRDGYFRREHLLPAVQSGAVHPEVIDDKVRRMLRAMAAMVLLDDPQPPPPTVPDNRLLARDAAAAGLVLLQNKGALPLASTGQIAVLGPNAAVARTGGAGSSAVDPEYAVSPFDGLRTRAGTEVTVVTSPGLAGPSASPQEAGDTRAEAVSLALAAEVAIVVVGYTAESEGEGRDRSSLSLPDGQDELVAAVAAANPRTVVVIVGGGPVLMPWIDAVDAVVMAWYAGSEGGTALAEVLFGDRPPSGRLPVTFPRQWEDSHAFGRYPGADSVEYSEGLFVGYRYADRNRIAPLFALGHGLGYTTFVYERVSARIADRAVELTVTVRNSGEREGVEVVQVYVSPVPARPELPDKELKGFVQVSLLPGEAAEAVVTLPRSAFAHYDLPQGEWSVAGREFDLLVGASAVDIRLVQRVSIPSD